MSGEDAYDAPWPEVHPAWHAQGSGPAEAFPVPFTPFDGLALLAWGIVAPLVVGIALALFAGVTIAGTSALVALVVLQAVTFAGVVLILRARGAWSWRLLGPTRPAPRHVAIGLVGGAVAWAGITAALGLFAQLTGYEPSTEQSLLDDARNADTLDLVLVVVIACIFAPVLEEVVHRAVLFQSLRRRAGLLPGVLLSSAAFALVHLELRTEPVLLVGLAILGAVLAVLLHRSGSLLTAVVAHATYNSVTLVAALTFLAGP